MMSPSLFSFFELFFNFFCQIISTDLEKVLDTSSQCTKDNLEFEKPIVTNCCVKQWLLLITDILHSEFKNIIIKRFYTIVITHFS